MSRMPVPLLVILNLLALDLFASVALCIFGASDNVVFLVAQGGTSLIMLGGIAYVVAFDSRKRWPHVGTFTRLIRVLTFYTEKP